MNATPRERIVTYLEDYQAAHKRPPSQREIVADTGVPQSTLRWHVARLVRDGRVRKGPGARSLMVNHERTVAA